ncbi:MAG TPA: hypothetical protein VIN11_04765 [Roseivirga sp.]
MKKLYKNFIASIIIFIVVIGISYFTDGWETTKQFLDEYWWVFALLPFALTAYFWFRGVKRKAFDLGYNSVDKALTKKEKTEE